jgi:hypothetical protein
VETSPTSRPTSHRTSHRTSRPTSRPTLHCPPRCSPRRPLPGHVASAHVTSLTSTLARSRRGTYKNLCFCSGRPKALWKFRFFLARHAVARLVSHFDPPQVTLRHVPHVNPRQVTSRRPSPGHFESRHVSHVDPRQVTSRDFSAKLWNTCLPSSSSRRRPFSGRKRP